MKRVRFLEALLALAATATVLLNEAGLPSDTFWKTWSPLTYPAVIVLAYLAGSQILDRGIQERRLAVEKRATESLKAALVAIQALTQLDWLDIGVHAFLIRKTWHHPIQGELRRVARERFR